MLPVPESINFAKEEEKILEFWKSIDAFKTSLNQSKGKPKYTFYDGPPFATGLPHYGHILAGTIKDIVTRFAHQSGFHVDRRFGWDTHGLPVEYEIDKTLGIKGPEDVAKMGIDKYNAECRKIVMRYAGEWETVVARMGRWIDFENDYKTMYPWFMESVWWVFKQLFVKGLVYKGFKVMPFSTACSTPLSNFESGQNYKDVIDPAVIVSFPLDSDPKTSLLAWTTTPWTLPSNLALCVNPGLTYVKVKDTVTGNVYILMESRLVSLYKSEAEYTILEKCLGSKLKGLTYEPLFPYFAHLKKQGAFKVLTDTYVTEESGTGVVHQSPYFGEEDFRVCLAAGVITKDQDMVCPVDESGRFMLPVQDFLGMHVKDADKHIIKHLTEKKRMIHSGQTKHSYPFCWRSETPLIYKAVPSWFIRVEQMSQRLLDNNQQTYWVPEFVKEKRFANWLRDARDWAVSRNRYWGTPIPLWVSEDGEEIICVGSVEELKELSGVLVTDLHRETVDTIEIPSARPGKPPLKRVTEVFDCWFESGSMPYAQAHYPFEHKREFENSFPADFIAEGIDQTRGWFYTLLVLSTALFDTPPFKNLIVNGLVLASDGQKMSKSKKNFPDPLQIVNKFGADALRLYLINSPVVRAENLRFKEEGVRDIVKDVFLPWYNAYRFFAQNLERWEREENLKFSLNEDTLTLSPNLMDRWLVSFVQSLLEFVKAEMRAYRLYTVVPRLVRFVDQLTNWYVRMNRKRLKGDSGREDCQRALETLFSVLLNLTKIMAPFTPFLTELMYKNLKSSVAENQNDPSRASVHFLPLPEPRTGLMDTNIERAVARMQTVVELGRVIRDRKTIPIKYPLKEVVVIHRDPQCLADLKALERYIVEELNVRVLTLTSDKASYGVTLRAEPDHKTLGARLKDAFKSVTLGIKALSDAQLQTFLAEGKMEVGGHLLGLDDVRLFYSFAGEKAAELALQYEAHSDNDILVMLDISPDQAMQEEGIAREVINRVQKLRKKAKLLPSDEVLVHYQVSPNDNSLATIVTSYTEFIEATIKMPLRPLDAVSFCKTTIIIEEVQQLKGAELKLVVTKNQAKAEATETFVVHGSPACKFVNLFFHDSKVVRGGTLLLENAQSEAHLTTTELLKQTGLVFNLAERNVEVKTLEGQDVLELDIKTLHGQTLVVHSKAENNGTTTLNHLEGSVCRFVNVQRGEKVATVLLENPVGSSLRPEELRQVVEAALRLGYSSKAQFYADKECKNRVNFPDGILQFNGKTLYISS